MTAGMKRSGEQPCWKPFASFVIELQVRTLDDQKQAARTKVHHIETDSCAVWPGLAEVPLCQWMLLHLPIDSA